MKHREGTGSLKCRMCDASFQMPIHHLHEPIDVFSEWLDECEAAEKRNNGLVDEGSSSAAIGGGAIGGGRLGGDEQRGYDYDSDEEDDLGGGSGLQNNSSTSNKAQQQHSLTSLGVGDSDDDSE